MPPMPAPRIATVLPFPDPGSSLSGPLHESAATTNPNASIARYIAAAPPTRPIHSRNRRFERETDSFMRLSSCRRLDMQRPPGRGHRDDAPAKSTSLVGSRSLLAAWRPFTYDFGTP